MKEQTELIVNSFAKFKEKFDLRKSGTLLEDKTLIELDETQYDLESILDLLR